MDFILWFCSAVCLTLVSSEPPAPRTDRFPGPTPTHLLIYLLIYYLHISKCSDWVAGNTFCWALAQFQSAGAARGELGTTNPGTTLGHLWVSLSPFLDKISLCVPVMLCNQTHNFGLSFGLLLLMPDNGYMWGEKEKTSAFDQCQRFQTRATLKLIQRNLFKIFIIFLSVEKLTHRCMSKCTHCHLSCLGPSWFPFYFYSCFYSFSPLFNSDNSNHLSF